MGYTALYRKFRPLTFSEMVGQEHITKTLKNQIISDRIGHAYLFNGGRGTGKTSSAKILARAINCLNPHDGEPCNECEICKQALSGALTDIVEMDAASNNSVEDIRNIREEVNFLPTKAKYRVYIIDEVHMLSTGAFNALLKTLEEPPEHVKFILATTEPQKLPATILSRCQRFDFKRILNEDIIKRLEIVCKESKIDITKEALNIIAVLSEGAMRDALSILERCIQDGENKIDEDKIKDLVGIPKMEYVHKIVQAIIEYNVDKALVSIQEVLKGGKDINNFLWEIIKYVKDILLFKTNGNLELYSNEEIQNIETLANKLDKQRAINLIYELCKIEENIKWSNQKTIIFQAGIIKLCNKEISNSNTNNYDKTLLDRIQNIENYLKSNNTNRQNSNSVKNANISDSSNKEKSKKENKPKVVYNGKVQDYWPKLVEDLKNKGKIVLYTNLINTVAKEINDMTIGIEFPQGITPFGKTVLEKPENIKEISDLVSIACGKEMNIKLIDNKAENVENTSENSSIEEFANGLDLPFNIID